MMTLRLLIDLYHAQNLRDDGGISRAIIWQSYERFEVGRQAQFKVWGFRYKSCWVTWTGPTLCHRRQTLTEQEIASGENGATDYFRRKRQLVGLGLIEWVPTLVEGEGARGGDHPSLWHGRLQEPGGRGWDGRRTRQRDRC